MLPLFDVIIASESTTFAAPYGKLGCIPEGITFVKPSQFLHKALVSLLIKDNCTENECSLLVLDKRVVLFVQDIDSS